MFQEFFVTAPTLYPSCITVPPKKNNTHAKHGIDQNVDWPNMALPNMDKPLTTNFGPKWIGLAKVGHDQLGWSRQFIAETIMF